MMNRSYANGLGGWFGAMTALTSPAHGALTREPLYERAPQLRLRPDVVERIDRMAATVQLWRERARQRRALGRLDDHLLDDLGLTRAQVERETRKPFWRA